MIKKVRVENADLDPHGVLVQIWHKGYPEGTPDTLHREVHLKYPTEMTDGSVYVTGNRYLVIKEAP